MRSTTDTVFQKSPLNKFRLRSRKNSLVLERDFKANFKAILGSALDDWAVCGSFLTELDGLDRFGVFDEAVPHSEEMNPPHIRVWIDLERETVLNPVKNNKLPFWIWNYNLIRTRWSRDWRRKQWEEWSMLEHWSHRYLRWKKGQRRKRKLRNRSKFLWLFRLPFEDWEEINRECLDFPK